MIQLTPQMRLLVAVAPVDFRRGIDGLCRLCREVLSADPFSGAVFVFRNQRGTSIKLLAYDGQGYWLCQKRLSQANSSTGRKPAARCSASFSRMSSPCCSRRAIPRGRKRPRSGAE